MRKELLEIMKGTTSVTLCKFPDPCDYIIYVEGDVEYYVNLLIAKHPFNIEPIPGYDNAFEIDIPVDQELEFQQWLTLMGGIDVR